MSKCERSKVPIRSDVSRFSQGSLPSAPLTSAAIPLTERFYTSTLTGMEVHLRPETESRLNELAEKTGRAPDELVEDAMAGYMAELTEVRNMLDGRYDEIKSGRVKPIDGDEAFGLRLATASDFPT
jgi:predicted transcriptional regulator